MMGLTRQQGRVLAIIRDANRRGTAPTYDELCLRLGLASKSGVNRLVIALEKRGAIRRLPNQARALEAIEPIDPLEDRSTPDLLAMRARIDAILGGRGS